MRKNFKKLNFILVLVRVLKSKALYYLLNIPEKSIKGNMASSGMFVIAVQTFSSNNFNTVKEKNIRTHVVLSDHCIIKRKPKQTFASWLSFP